ncbi:hypothetical protein ACFV2U_42975 [Streptomyces sp. NPDC059697]|uniref:hypothetical protein n=1 Tax=Streptomyces sp. NPDC059697 TaxID=3346912 RepID=UPI0036C343F9
MDGTGKFRICLFSPVIAEVVEVLVAQVVGRGVGDECLGEVEADAEAAGVHRRLQDRARGRRDGLVTVEEFRGADKILSEAHVVVNTG